MHRNHTQTILKNPKFIKINKCVLLVEVENESFKASSLKDVGDKRKFKLFETELNLFSSDATQFLSFWNLLKKSPLVKSLPAKANFYYLLQIVVPKFKAFRIVRYLLL